MVTKTIRVRIQTIEKVDVSPPDQAAKWDYRCTYLLQDGDVNQSGQFSFPTNVTAQRIQDGLQLIAEAFAKREHWFEDLKSLENTELDFEFDVGG